MVGDNRRIELPDFKRVRVASGRFRGLRCVHTHLRGEPLTQDDLTDLALLRLDLMAAIDVDAESGLPGLVRAAHLLPLHAGELDNATTPELYGFLEPKVASQLDQDFQALINSLEEEMARNRRTARRAEVRDRTILVGVATGSLADAEESMAELAELAASAGVMVQDKIIQRRSAIDPRTVLGRGKLDELIIRALQLGAVHSHFVNPNGLPVPGQYSSARDLSLIARAAYANPTIRSIVCLPQLVFRYSNGRTRELENTNKLLRRLPYCNGMKTGYTDGAGKCLIASGTRPGKDVIVVVLGDSSSKVWRDASALLSWGLLL